MTEVSGKRVRLRAITAHDLNHVHRWRSDPQITRYWVTREALSPVELQSWLDDKRRSSDLGFIVEDETGTAIGIVDLFNINRQHRRAELSLMIGERDRQGMGYGREALMAILDHAFAPGRDGGQELHKVSLSVFAENFAAIKLYESCGFREDGVLREDMYYDRTWHDQILMSILAQEFRRNDR
jgi:RimJ/RimL family protein N-acetyltransferase